MTLLFTESFDTNTPDDARTYAKWFDSIATTTGGGGMVSAQTVTTGRFGTGSANNFNCASGGGGGGAGAPTVYRTADVGSEQSVAFIGFAWMDGGFTASASSAIQCQFLDENLAIQIDMLYTFSTRLLSIRRGGSTTLCTISGSPALIPNSWYYVEIGAKISPTVGWVEVRINGLLVATYYGTTGTSRASSNGNTRNSAISGVRLFRIGALTSLGANGGTYTFSIDDLVIYNDQGARNNNFLGDLRVIGGLPNAVGTHSDFTRTGGTASGNYTAVSENPIDGDTSYVAAATPGNIDTYNYADLPTSAVTVLAACSYPTARRDDAGPSYLTTRVRSGGVEADAATVTLTGSTYATYTHMMELNPVTGLVWTVAEINAAEFGPKRVISAALSASATITTSP